MSSSRPSADTLGSTSRAVEPPTPGAWSQARGRASDGSTGNGDDGIMNVTSSRPVQDRVRPTRLAPSNATRRRSRDGEDGGVAQLSMDADSSASFLDRLVDPSRSTSVAERRVARVIAHSGSLRYTAIAIISPRSHPESDISSGTARESRWPRLFRRTMLLDVRSGTATASRTSRVRVDSRMRVTIAISTLPPAVDIPLDAPGCPGAARSGAAASLPSCRPVRRDLRRTDAPQTIRLAFVTGRIAARFEAGDWIGSGRSPRDAL